MASRAKRGLKKDNHGNERGRRAVLDKGANMVSRTRECAIDPLSVPALLALATLSICCWTSAAARDTLAQHPCISTALRASAGCSLPEPQSSDDGRV